MDQFGGEEGPNNNGLGDELVVNDIPNNEK